LHATHVRLNHGDTGFDQAAGEENRLAKWVTAIAVAGPGVFSTEVEGAGNATGMEELERLAFLSIKRGERGLSEGLVTQALEEIPALAESLDSEPHGEIQAFDAK
jgi:hypothetical protein